MKVNKNVKIDKSYLLTIRYFQAFAQRGFCPTTLPGNTKKRSSDEHNETNYLMKLNTNVKIDKSYLLTIRNFHAKITRIPIWVFNPWDFVQFRAFSLTFALLIFICTSVTVKGRSYNKKVTCFDFSVM